MVWLPSIRIRRSNLAGKGGLVLGMKSLSLGRNGRSILNLPRPMNSHGAGLEQASRKPREASSISIRLVGQDDYGRFDSVGGNSTVFDAQATETEVAQVPSKDIRS